MATTHELAGGDLTVTVRGTPKPTTQYGYAAVMTFEGRLPVLIRRSAEAAVKGVLASERTASWTWLDDDALAIRFTRRDPAHAATVVEAVLDRLDGEFASARERFDDGAFDEAMADREGSG